MKRCCLTGLLTLAPPAPADGLTPLPDFKLEGYVATWYEIASIRGFLQSRCSRDTRPEYSMAENGALMLETNCLRADGAAERSEARARPLDPALPSVLKITGVHMLGIWWYPFGRESIVVPRGPDRRWLAVVMVRTVQTDGRQQPARVCDIVRTTTLPPALVPGTLQ